MNDQSNLMVIRSERSKNYKTVGLFCVQDNSLSWKAKGIHTYLITRPPDWKIRYGDLKKRSTDGTTSLDSGITELIKKGYVFRMVQRDEKKSFIQWGLFVVEQPATIQYIQEVLTDGWTLSPKAQKQEPFQGNPCSGEPISGEHGDIIIKEKINNKNLISFQDISFQEISLKDKTDSQGESDQHKNRTGLYRRDTAQKIRDQMKVSPIKKKPKPVMPEVKAPPDVQKVIDVWETLGLFKNRRNTKIYKEGVESIKKLLQGTFFDNTIRVHKGLKFTEAEITIAFKNFALAALNMDYEPAGEYKTHLAKMPLASFFYNPFATNGNKSLFLDYLKKRPKVLSETFQTIPDPNSTITAKLKDWYVKEVKGGLNCKFTAKEENDFRQATRQLIEFYNNNKQSVNFLWQNTPLVDFAYLLCEAIYKSVDGRTDKLSSGWFSSGKTFSERLPSYLAWQGYTQPKESEFSIYDDL